MANCCVACVFADEYPDIDGEMERYTSKEDAIAGHGHMVSYVYDELAGIRSKEPPR